MFLAGTDHDISWSVITWHMARVATSFVKIDFTALHHCFVTTMFNGATPQLVFYRFKIVGCLH